MKATIYLLGKGNRIISSVTLEANIPDPENTFLVEGYIITTIHQMTLIPNNINKVHHLYDMITTFNSDPQVYHLKAQTEIHEIYHPKELIELDHNQIYEIYCSIKYLCGDSPTDIRLYRTTLAMYFINQVTPYKEQKWNTLCQLIDTDKGIDTALLELINRASHQTLKTAIYEIKNLLRIHIGSELNHLYLNLTIEIYSPYMNQYRILDNIQEEPISRTQSQYILNNI